MAPSELFELDEAGGAVVGGGRGGVRDGACDFRSDDEGDDTGTFLAGQLVDFHRLAFLLSRPLRKFDVPYTFWETKQPCNVRS